MKYMIEPNGMLWRGALHLHTNRSDGRKTPAEVAAMYRAAGCDFLAFTDHWVYGEAGEIDGMLLLSGCEYNIGDQFEYPVHHIVGLGMKREPVYVYDESAPPRYIIDGILHAEGIAVLAHPAWSMMNPADISKMDGISAVEIYNNVSGLPNNTRPDSSFFIDIWANQGLCYPCLATDDYHGIALEDGPCAYTSFYAPALTRESVLAAITQGQCFGTQGPIIKSAMECNGVITVNFSKAARVVFSTNTIGGDGKVFNGPLTEAEYHIRPQDRFVRVVIEDENRNLAWSSVWNVR